MLLDKAIANNSTKYWESIDPDLEFHMHREGRSPDEIAHAVQEIDREDDADANLPVGVVVFLRASKPIWNNTEILWNGYLNNLQF